MLVKTIKIWKTEAVPKGKRMEKARILVCAGFCLLCLIRSIKEKKKSELRQELAGLLQGRKLDISDVWSCKVGRPDCFLDPTGRNKIKRSF